MIRSGQSTLLHALHGNAAAWLIPLAAIIAGATGFAHPVGMGWLEGVLDLVGISLAVAGMLPTVAGRPPEGFGPDTALWRLAGIPVTGSGLALVLGRLPLAVVLLGAFLLTLGVGFWFRRGRQRFDPEDRPEWRQHAGVVAVSEGRTLCGVVALLVLLEMWKAAVAPGGLKAHSLELGACGMLLAVLGLACAAAFDGLSLLPAGVAEVEGSLSSPGPAEEGRVAGRAGGRMPTPTGLFVGALLLFGCFLLLALAIQQPAVLSLDADFARLAYKSGGPAVTRLLRKISNAGGRDLVLLWLPFVLLALCLLRRARSLWFFVPAMFGSVGLEVVFKDFFHRARPDLVRHVHFDSFPSGHALAATILAGALLLIWLPVCRRPWQRVLLWSAALLWPILMSVSRVYLGRHYPTDVLGSVLLGVAWILLCKALLLTLGRAGFGRRQLAAIRGAGSPLNRVKGRHD